MNITSKSYKSSLLWTLISLLYRIVQSILSPTNPLTLPCPLLLSLYLLSSKPASPVCTPTPSGGRLTSIISPLLLRNRHKRPEPDAKWGKDLQIVWGIFPSFFWPSCDVHLSSFDRQWSTMSIRRGTSRRTHHSQIPWSTGNHVIIKEGISPVHLCSAECLWVW